MVVNLPKIVVIRPWFDKHKLSISCVYIKIFFPVSFHPYSTVVLYGKRGQLAREDQYLQSPGKQGLSRKTSGLGVTGWAYETRG